MHTLPKRVRHSILPALAAVFWGVTVWIDLVDGVDVDRDDRLPTMLAIIFSVWALIDWYYRKLLRGRDEALAGHDMSVLAEGVAAFIAQQGDGQNAPGPRPKNS